MKMFNNIKNFTFCALLTLLSFGAVSCTEDEVMPVVVTEGVVFQFDMRTEYTISNMMDIVTVDMTLIKDGEEIILSNLKLDGTELSVLSAPVSLAEGTYTMKGYVAYGESTAKIMECEFDLEDEKSTFEVVVGQVLTVEIPVVVRIVDIDFYVSNALLGLCREVFGDDESLWPWDRTEKVGTWLGLEFVYFDGTNDISHLGGIHFDSKEFEGWNVMTKVPNGTISKLITIECVSFYDLPNLNELPDDLNKLPSLLSVVALNTGLESLPENFEKCKSLGTVILDGAALTEFPAQLNKMEKLSLIGILNTKITEVTVPLTNLKLVGLDLSHNQIATFGEDVLSSEVGIRSIKLNDNNLSSLPNSFATLASLTSVDIMNNKFASIPSQLEGITGLMTLRIGGNALTSISTADISVFPNLIDLDLEGSKGISVGALTHAKMGEISLSNCGLTSLPSIAGMPNIRLFEAANNDFTSIASLDFTATPLLSKINLSNNAKLKSLPTSTWGLSPLAPGVFGYLDLRNCPVLNWTPNAAWNAFNYAFEMYDPNADHVNPSYIVPPVEEYKDRVGIAKQGSNGVVIR